MTTYINMSHCPLCGKNRKLIKFSPFYGDLASETDKTVQICEPCSQIWEDQNVKPYTKVLKQHLWSDKPKNGLDAVLRPLRLVNYLIRYGSEITANPESLAEHTFSVMFIANQIAGDLVNQGFEVNFRRVYNIAMFHDMGEIMTGDLPTPLKTPTIKKEVDRLESRASDIFNSWGVHTNDIDSYDYQVWKNTIVYKPKIVVIEINSGIDPYNTEHIHKPNHFQGTSFFPMYKLGLEKGYSFVLHTGNMIFIRDDLYSKLNLYYFNYLENFRRKWLS